MAPREHRLLPTDFVGEPVISKGAFSSDEQWSLQVQTEEDPTTNDRTWFAVATGALDEVGNVGRFEAPDLFNRFKWTHLVYVYDGTSSGNANRLKLYVDGAPVAMNFGGTIAPTMRDSQDPLEFGRMAGLGRYHEGYVDEVAIFGTSLDQIGIDALRTNGRPADLTGQSGLISWWRMGEGDIYPTLSDSAGTNPGTMTNMESDAITGFSP